MFCKWIHEFIWLNSCVSVREFTGFCEKIRCVDTCLPWNHQFFTSCHFPVKPYQFWPSTTCSKPVTTGRTCVFTWIHMKTCTGGAVPIMNQYDTCQMVPCLHADYLYVNMKYPPQSIARYPFVQLSQLYQCDISGDEYLLACISPSGEYQGSYFPLIL